MVFLVGLEQEEPKGRKENLDLRDLLDSLEFLGRMDLKD